MLMSNQHNKYPLTSDHWCYSAKVRLSVKINDEYRDFKELPQVLLSQQGPVGPARPAAPLKAITAGRKCL
jgi:hypothetical protein